MEVKEKNKKVGPCVHVLRKTRKQAFSRRSRVAMAKGSFSNDDGDGNQDVKKSSRFITQNNNFARVSRFFVHFFTVLARLRRENA